MIGKARAAVRTSSSSLWLAAVALLFAAAFGANISTPLLLIYRVRLGIPPSGLTAIFGVYALGLAPSLLFGGPASDRYGRLRVLLPAVALAAVASLIFLPGANSVPMLFAARFVQGLASGAAFSVGSAWLQDLVPSTWAARRASLALNLGFCAGPLVSGLLAEAAAGPLLVPYLVHVVLVVAVLVLAALSVRAAAWRDRPSPARGLFPRTGLAAPARRVFRRALLPTAVCVYAFPSVAVTVLPLELPRETHLVGFTGVLAAATLGTGALVQLFARLLGEWCGATGAALGALGYGAAAAAAAPQSTAVVLAGGVLLGAGGGLCLYAGLRLIGELARPDTRGACTGLFYAWAYTGFAMPLLATSFVPVSRLLAPLSALAVAAAAVAGWLAATRG
ncbi:MFS transporter [Amycolatopsis benzoatilytica]|uniref:MFS transporter n=1 Tax=Amycolatopsis benzoatilytica TaxID=346045 RepID=UPI00036026A4|nr:MFS transporter [Amycolatopsis benzoatilytica]